MTIRSLIEFHVREGESEAFRKAYTDGGMLTRATLMRGFIRGELMRSTRDPDRWMATAEWETEEDYRRWQDSRASAIAQQHVRSMVATLTHLGEGEMFEVVQTAGRDA